MPRGVTTADRFVSPIPKHLNGRLGQVFVYFDAHRHFLCRQWNHDVLVHHVGGIGQRRPNVLIGQLRIVILDFLWRHPIGEAAYDDCHGNTSPLDAWIIVVDIWCNSNPFLPSYTTHFCHLLSLFGQSAGDLAIVSSEHPQMMCIRRMRCVHSLVLGTGIVLETMTRRKQVCRRRLKAI